VSIKHNSLNHNNVQYRTRY